MNRNSGNVSKTKKLISGAGNNSKPNRKSLKKLSESSSISSNKNSSGQSEEDVRVGGVYKRPQMTNNVSFEEQEQIMKKLHAQVKDLRHKLRVLEESVDSKDYSLGTIAREKDRAMGEVRRLERSNKQLRQQLNDERNHYLEEKEKFCEEMTRYKKRLQDLKTFNEAKKTNSKWNPILPISKQSLITQQLKWQFDKEKGDFNDNNKITDLKNSKSQKLPGTKEEKPIAFGSTSCSESHLRKPSSFESFHLYEGNDLSLQMAALRTENAKLRSIICERDERNYELCLRFLRMKHYKNDIRNRFQDLENEYLQVIANLMDKIDEARQEFNFIIDQKFRRPLHSTNAMYLQLVQRNSRMAFENASLRLENQCLKKELNKYINGVSEHDRKFDQVSIQDDTDTKQTLLDSKDDNKLKRIKKNVNFKEIRTIYKRNLEFKNSDTDSNYMSKTSTTAPSNGSLADPKSNESIIKCVEDGTIETQKTQPSFQASSLPNEILNKIFKRIDTSSCQSVDSGRSKDLTEPIKVTRVEDVKENKLIDTLNKIPQTSSQITDIKKINENNNKKLQNESKLVKNENKCALNVTDSSSPCESKESVRMNLKDNIQVSSYATKELVRLRQESGDLENLKTRKNAKLEPEKWKTYRSRLRTQSRVSKNFDKDSGDGSSSLDFPVRPLEMKMRMGRHERVTQPKQLQETVQVKNRYREKSIKDSCGLQEKIDFSSWEMPEKAESKIQAKSNISKINENNREKPEVFKMKTEMPESDDDLPQKGSRRDFKTNIPVMRTRSKSSGNMISLHDELMEATKNQADADNPFWRREMRFHSKLPKGPLKTYRINKESSIFYKSQQYEETEPAENRKCVDKQTLSTLQESSVTHPRRSEGSKRFSHRLMSTSPEKLKTILTESQLGDCYQMAPVIVGHATTEMNQEFKYNDPNNEFNIPTLEKTAQVLADHVIPEKVMVEKETSVFGLDPVDQTKAPVEVCASDIRIPVSSLPTSSSTMDVVDSAAINDYNNIMLRTLSAPGLLESSWLDPYNICEMRDCSTNT